MGGAIDFIGILLALGPFAALYVVMTLFLKASRQECGRQKLERLARNARTGIAAVASLHGLGIWAAYFWLEAPVMQWALWYAAYPARAVQQYAGLQAGFAVVLATIALCLIAMVLLYVGALATVGAALRGKDIGVGRAVLVKGRLVGVKLAPAIVWAVLAICWPFLLSEPLMATLILVALSAAVSSAGPQFVAASMRTEKLPENHPAAAAARKAAQDAGIGITGTSLMESGEGEANAMVTGLVDGNVRVFLTEELFRLLSAKELEAVLAHEAAHVASRHLVWHWLAGVLWAVSMPRILQAIEFARGGSGEVPPLWIGWAVALAWTVSYSVLSRIFEAQADTLAARRVGPEALASALLKIEAFNGGTRRQWLALLGSHPSLERRLRNIGMDGRPLSNPGAAQPCSAGRTE